MDTDRNPPIHQAYRFMSNGQLESAGRILAELLETEPEHAEALQMLGLVRALSGKPREAAQLLRRASRLEPGNGALLANLARAYWDSGQVLEAAQAWDQVIALGQADADLWSDRAVVLRSLGRHDDALDSLEQAIALEPHHLGAWTNRGNILHEIGRFDAALACQEKALALQPESAAAWANKASTLDCMGQYEEALGCYDTALTLMPQRAMTWSNRGVTLRHLGKIEEARASLNQAIALDAACVNAWINRGTLETDLREHARALLDYGHALQLAPGHGDAMSGEALARLAMGDFEVGWQRYEIRWKHQNAEKRRHGELPLWLGEQSLAGKRLLLWAEQGLGDTLQFCRYAQLAIQAGAQVVLEVQPALQRLLAQSFPACEVLAIGEPLPACDLQTPLLSLPLAFKTRLDTIPARTPYLYRQATQATPSAPTGAIHAGGLTTGSGSPVPHRRLVPGARPRIGIACSGKPSHAGNQARSMPLAAFAPLQKIADLVLLQKDVSADDLLFLRGNPAIHHPLARMADFADTAQIAGDLDLIISVDTSLAHLAGAMALPTWVLLPWASEWRWLTERDDSPWYPGMRLFRQDRAGNWHGVIVRVLGALANLFAQRG